jgi:hypothetical protein
MQNHFYFSSHVLLLFKEWQIHSVGVLVAAFTGVFVFTYLYEIASFYQARYANGRPNNLARRNQTQFTEGEEQHSYGTFGHVQPSSVPDSSEQADTIPLRARIKIAFTSRYILSSLLFPFFLAANYFIMLAVMTYNAWLLIAVCLASGLAYFLLQPDHDVPVVKPCHHGKPGVWKLHIKKEQQHCRMMFWLHDTCCPQWMVNRCT